MEYPVEYRTRPTTVDGDTIDIRYRYDEMCGLWLGDYPYFVEEPRYTPNGRPWKNFIYNECPYAEHPGKECTLCPHFKREKPNDRIGVCFNDALRIDPAKVNEISIGGGNDK